jgi:hypothetical protein
VTLEAVCRCGWLKVRPPNTGDAAAEVCPQCDRLEGRWHESDIGPPMKPKGDT